MSKKKAFSGSTMTLKDFHGGSIPSDLPLPSAPGTVAKVPDRSERPGSGSSWGGSASRGFSIVDRGKQSFANNGQRGVSEDKVSYFPNSANIGRNFDEDERKPLDSFSSRRSSVNDEDYYDRTRDRDRLRTEGKFESAGVGIGHRASTLTSNEQTGFGHQYSTPLQPKQAAIVGRPGSGGSVAGQHQGRVSRVESTAPVSSSIPNAWGIRREIDNPSVNDNISSSERSAQSVASRFAQASAVDKVSSGRWQSRVSLGLEPHSDRFSQSQELDSLCNAQKIGLDPGNVGYGYSGVARTSGNGVQNNYNERDRCGFDNYGDNRKVFSPEVGKADAVNDDGRHISFEAARPGIGELAQVRLGHNVQYGGNAIGSWNKSEDCAESYKNDFEGRNINYQPKEKTLVSPHVENNFDGYKPYDSVTSAHSFDHSRDSLISEDVKNTLYSDRKFGHVVQNLDSDAVRNRFAEADVRVSSPLDVHRPGSTGSNHASAAAVSGSSVHLRAEERPKLKLLPRTKPLENALETAEVEKSQAGLMSKSYEYRTSSSSLPVKIASEAGNITHPTVKPLDTSDIEEDKQRSERPKLNLKPRSLPIEQLDTTIEKERKSVFGGARPREMVLKERGFDDSVINGLEAVPLANIGTVNKPNSKDTEHSDEKVEQNAKFSGSDNIIRRDNKVESISFDRRANNRHLERLDTSRSEWKDTEKKDFRAHTEKQELQKYPRRNENWRNQQNNSRQERRLDIDKQDSWRKSADSADSIIGLQKSASSPLLDPPTNTSGKFGRAASALELAEAFSRSASIMANGHRLSIQRSALTNSSADDASGRKTMPSHHTDSSVAREICSDSSQRQINGY